jgi:hypothetical protein
VASARLRIAAAFTKEIRSRRPVYRQVFALRIVYSDARRKKMQLKY